MSISILSPLLNFLTEEKIKLFEQLLSFKKDEYIKNLFPDETSSKNLVMPEDLSEFEKSLEDPKKITNLIKVILAIAKKELANPNLSLTADENLLISKYSPTEMLLIFQYMKEQNFSFIEKDQKRIEKNDILQVSFLLCNTSLQTANSEMFIQNNLIVKPSFDNIVSSGSNYLQKGINLFFVVTNADKGIQFTDVFDLLHTTLWKEHFKNLMPSNIILNSIQFKIVDPVERKSFLQKRSYLDNGALNSNMHEASTRPYTLRTSNPLLIGSYDENAIRFPFVTNNFINSNSMNFSNLEKSMNQLVSCLERDLTLNNGDNKEKVNLSIHLALKTTRSDVPLNYLPVITIAKAGLIKRGYRSAVRIPINGNGNFNNNGNNTSEESP